MKAIITNNRKAPYGVELEGGGYRFVKPGETRTVDAANVRAFEYENDLEVELIGDLDPPPASLVAKVAPKAKAKAPARAKRRTRRSKAPPR